MTRTPRTWRSASSTPTHPVSQDYRELADEVIVRARLATPAGGRSDERPSAQTPAPPSPACSRDRPRPAGSPAAPSRRIASRDTGERARAPVTSRAAGTGAARRRAHRAADRRTCASLSRPDAGRAARGRWAASSSRPACSPPRSSCSRRVDDRHARRRRRRPRRDDRARPRRAHPRRPPRRRRSRDAMTHATPEPRARPRDGTSDHGHADTARRDRAQRRTGRAGAQEGVALCNALCNGLHSARPLIPDSGVLFRASWIRPRPPYVHSSLGRSGSDPVLERHPDRGSAGGRSGQGTGRQNTEQRGRRTRPRQQRVRHRQRSENGADRGARLRRATGHGGWSS